MSNDPVEPGVDADDLIGRWLAHHDNPADEGAAPSARRVPIAARPSSAAVPRTRLSASAALAELREATTVDLRDGLGPVVAPSTFGARRGQPGSAHSGPTGAPRRGADGDVAELDRPSPLGFEPVLLRSVRKKSEPKAEEPEKDKRGRLARLRSRVAGPVEETASAEPSTVEAPPVSLYDAPVAYVPPPVFDAPPPAAPVPPAPQRSVVPFEDVVALSVAASLPVTEPAPQTEPEPEPEPIPELVLPGPDTPPAPLSVLPEHQDDGEEPDVPTISAPATDTATEAEVPTKRRLVARTRVSETDEPEERKRRPLVARSTPGTGTAGAARGLLAAARAATPTPKAPTPARPAPEVAQVPLLPVEAPVDPVPAAPAMEMPAVYEFAPRKSSRRFLTLMLVSGLVMSGYLGYAAYQSRDTAAIGLAAIVTLATLVIWAIRAGATVTRLTVRRGQLEIVRQGGRMVFDLASTYTAIEVVGRPGSKKWKVNFLRRGMSPVTVDATMVDGRDFMKILSFYRPDLAAS
jgi:hypothetical protein